jgi:hypothetical protein
MNIFRDPKFYSMKTIIFALLAGLLVCVTPLYAQISTVSADKNWNEQLSILKNTDEAAFIIRLGDVDNLGFGWPNGFDPFCGRMTESHIFPWEMKLKRSPGFDRILLSSKYTPTKNGGCSSDGYSYSYDKVKTKPVAWNIPTDVLKGATIQNAYLQIFIDDFQSPSMCSAFQLKLNGKRFVEAEKFLNAIDQTGPVGKLISIPIPEEYFADLSNNNFISLLIDESKGAADGFAIDFIRLLINRNRENTCKGTIRGKVFEKDTENLIAGAR